MAARRDPRGPGAGHLARCGSCSGRRYVVVRCGGRRRARRSSMRRGRWPAAATARSTAGCCPGRPRSSTRRGSAGRSPARSPATRWAIRPRSGSTRSTRRSSRPAHRGGAQRARPWGRGARGAHGRRPRSGRAARRPRARREPRGARRPHPLGADGGGGGAVSTSAAVIGGGAVVTVAIKSAGPAALGGRELPECPGAGAARGARRHPGARPRPPAPRRGEHGRRPRRRARGVAHALDRRVRRGGRRADRGPARPVARV